MPIGWERPLVVTDCNTSGLGWQPWLIDRNNAYKGVSPIILI